jgi:mono/diheme cytochrome c family protein
MRRVFVVAVLLFIGAGAGANASSADDATTRFDFVLNCSGCHGTDAGGSATVPALGETDALIATREGRDYLIRVPGVAQSPLSDERLARLMNFVVREFGRAPEFEPFTAAEVSRLRASPLRSPLSTRP